MKLAVIGTNWLTDSFIAGAEKSGAWQLSAVYSRTFSQAEKFASKYDQPELFTDIEKMAKTDTIDAVYVASPNALHYEQTLLFLKAGKHVIVEKPIFSTITELEYTHQIARENNAFLFEAARHIHEPNFKTLQSNLVKVGKVTGATFTYMKYSSRYDSVLDGNEPNIFSLKYAGGSVVDLGVYPLYSAVSLFGEPVRAQYFATKIGTGVDINGPIILTYPDFYATLIQGKNATSVLPSEIYGESGTLWFNPLTSVDSIRYYSNKKKGTEASELAEKTSANDMQYEANEFARIITERDYDSYEYLTDLSIKVLRTSNHLRHQNDIYFANEK